MQNPAIVVPCYNKLQPLKRLLSSLILAKYPDFVKIVFSIDAGGNPEILDSVKAFHWPNGEKVIIDHSEHIGLKANILYCGDLSCVYGSVIVLEDDSYVSMNYYYYAMQAMEYYLGNDQIGGISLYAYDYCEIGLGRFFPLSYGYDTYFMQWASSRGQLWTEDQWRSFRKWYDKNKETELSEINIPQKVANWGPSSWKKYYIAYLVDTYRYFVYPYSSFVSNCGDVGQNTTVNSIAFAVTQVSISLDANIPNIRFSEYHPSAVRYDSFFEVSQECLKRNSALSDYEFDVDLSGLKVGNNNCHLYLLSSHKCNNPILSFDNVLIPPALNIINNCAGKYYVLGKKADFVQKENLFFRVYRCYVNREIPTPRRSIDIIIAHILRKLGFAGYQK